MAENNKMLVTYELHEIGAKKLFVEKGVYKHPSDRWIYLYFNPMELTSEERDTLYSKCSCGIYNNQLIFEKCYLSLMNDIHELIEEIKD